MEIKEKYSIWAITLVLLLDVFTIIAIRNRSICWLWLLPIITFEGILFLLYKGNSKKLGYTPKGKVISNLLANVISPRFLSASYLLLFILHIGWITDASLNLFLADAYKEWVEIVISLLCGAIGTFFLIIFFPSSGGKGGASKLFISGISTPFVKNLPDDGQKYRELNLRPLVRIFQLSSDEVNDDSSMCLLKTNALDNKKCLSGIRDVYKLLKDVADNNNIIHTHTVETLFLEKDPISSEIIERMVKYLILSIAQKEFPQKQWLKLNKDDKKNSISGLENRIIFTPSCDYNNFINCYDVITKEIKDIEGKTLYFNISPGTGLISGLLTLIGVDSRHCLYYYSQITDDSISDFDRLTKIDKDLESVKKTLAEALG